MKYIGKHITDDLNDSYLGSGIYLINAIKKYGKENFEQIVIEEFDNATTAYLKEKEIVNKDLIFENKCYNLIIGGKGAPGGNNHPMFGKKRPDMIGEKNPAKRGESRYKISLHKTGSKNPMFGITPTNAKRILQYNTEMQLIKEWDTIKQASKELNIYNSNISMCCGGKLKTTGGFIWKYKKD